MSKKERPIYALIIDDKQDYCDALAGSARAERILLKSATNLEDGIEVLKNDKKIDFVILDGKCFVNADMETSGSTSNNIPHRAKDEIVKINNEQNREISFCVNTGFVDDLQESFEGIFEVFDKDKDSTDLFSHIKREVAQSPTYKVKKKYHECFEVFDLGIIDPVHEPLFIDILLSLEQSDFRKKNFSPMRDLLEASFLGLMDMGCIPSSFLNQKGKPTLEWCARYMEQRSTNDLEGNTFTLNVLVPQEMKSAIRKLKEATSAYSHLNDSDIIKYPFLSNAFLLMEYLTWLPDFYRANYE
ncbi:hypothetical protein [Sanyastnella coralliicola]|uniref:hypothetical protein n=1 Tax=Sanyastnella coralliicola TaxID=3069118 RepID=UPI0027BA5053|nr:hypothetical protein [Longitalea sp. SCSIO 12813]